MESFSLVVDEQVSYDCCTKQQHYLQPFVVFNLDPVKVRFHDGYLLLHGEQCHGNVGLFTLLCLLALQVRRLACQVASHVLPIPAFFAPDKIDSWGCRVRSGVVLGTIEIRSTRRAKSDLRYTELPTLGPTPLRLLFLHNDLRFRVVQLDCELVRKDRLGRRGHSAILAYLLLREGWVRPARLSQHFTKKNLWVVRVEEGYRISVLRCGGGRVDVVEGILRFRLGAILSEEERFQVLVGFIGGLEEESWGTLACILHHRFL